MRSKIAASISYVFLALSPVLLPACKNMSSKSHGPIVLGDSSTIVTEKDPRKLNDLVTDLQPDIPPAPNPDTAGKSEKTAETNNVKDTAKQTKPTQPVAENSQQTEEVAGLKAEFKEVTILLPGVSTKIAGNANLKNAKEAIYTLQDGSLEHNVLKIKGTITKVSQRVESVLIIKSKIGTLPLDNVTAKSEFEAVKAGRGGYPIVDIDEESLPLPKINNQTLRNAVTRACTRRKMNHKKVQEWVNTIANVHSANQKPLSLSLRSVIWKIDGKDSGGKAFSKQIRIDIPI